MLPAVFGPFRGNARGNAEGNRNAPQTLGGVGHNQRGVVGHATPSFYAVSIRVFRHRPDDTNRASGEGLDGSDPPFLTAGAVSRWGGCGTRWGTWWGTPTPPPGGSLPSVFIPAGRLPGPRAGRTISPTERPDA